MNILYINHYAGSPTLGMEFRPYYFAKEWEKMGHKVSIIAADYSHLRRINPQIEADFTKQIIEGVSYYWLKSKTYEGNGLKRALTMFQFVFKLYKNARKIADKFKPDLVITSSTYPLDTYAGQRIAHFAKAKLIHEVHDMWPLTLIEIGGIPKWNPFIVALQLAENSAYRNSDYVVSLLKYSENYMQQHGLEKGKFRYIPNGVDLQMTNSINPETEKIISEIKAIQEKDYFIVGYIGGHALSNALDDLLDVAEKLKDEKFHFVLVGNGVEKPRLIAKSKQKNLDNISFFDAIPKDDVPELLKAFNCGYLGALNSPLYRFGICMNKIFDYMNAGLPIICAITTPGSQVKEAECGICLDSGDIDGIVNALQYFKQMPKEELREIGLRGQKAIYEQYRYDKLAEQFIEDIFV